MADNRNIFERIFNLNQPTQEKAVGTSMMGYFGVGAEEPRNYKYQDLAKEGYLKNAIVYRCVNEISKGASSVPFIIKFKQDTIVEEHPIIDLLNRPNPLQSYTEFFSSLFGYVLLSGNAYVLKTGPDNGAPRELHQLRPDRIQIKGSGNPIPDRYDYILNGKVADSYAVDQESGYSELKHIKLWNPLDDYYGCSPLAAAAVEVDQHNLSSKHNVNLLTNGARPSGAVIFKPQDDSGLQVNLTESQRQQLLTDLNNRFSGAGNAGRPMLLEGDFDWKEMGLSPKDMDFLNLKHLSATDIAMCFGVPSQLVGVPDAQTYANVAEARLALYEETIIPYLRKIQSDLNEWLVPMFSEDLELEFDIDSIPALSERRRKIYENVTSAVREGIMTRNEARERIGLEPVKGGDGLYIAANLFPLGDEAVEEPEDPLNDEDLDALTGDEDDDDSGNDDKGLEDYYDLIDYHHAFGGKSLSDIDTKPTQGMAVAAKRGLEWREKYGRGGTAVGVARANQLAARESLSISTINRMHSFFSRHSSNDHLFSKKEPDGGPTAWRIAWDLWGSNEGQTWAAKKRDQIERESAKLFDGHEGEDSSLEVKAVSGAVKKGLQKKVDDHNDKYGDNPTKKTTLRTLISVFERGVGAYRTNPSSVRPTVNSEEQWAYARVNSYLRALRTGKFRSGKHDTDLFPKGHPLSSKK